MIKELKNISILALIIVFTTIALINIDSIIGLCIGALLGSLLLTINVTK